jgi:serine/threonine protein phosphatase PrpC
MKSISYTNKGLRPKNEDYLLSEQLSVDISFHIVADGMGGYSYGAEAAMIIAETMLSHFRQFVYSDSKEEIIIEACKKANLKLLGEGKKHSSKMGATFAATLIDGDTVYAFWMGDSRIYQYNENNQLLFQSEDHSLINELRLSRKLTTSEIRKYDSIVTRSLTGETMENPPQIEILQHSPKDKFILCSDGLHKQTNIDAILKMAQEDLLSYLASVNSRMNDNYSVIIVN